jgi:hypothetical protein
MKTLNLIIALLLCTQAYGQDFDLDDLKTINSEKKYKQFCFEKGFAFGAKMLDNLVFDYNEKL